LNINDTIMSKFLSFLTAIALFTTMAPVSLARNSSSDDRIKVKSATVETDRQRVIGTVKVCNMTSERVSFTIDVKNTTINSLYQRNLGIGAATCETYELDFTKNFAEMSNTGDEIEFSAKNARGTGSDNRYRVSNVYTTIVEEGNTEEPGCGDEIGEDDIFTPCINDFVYHEPTGLRIKVKSIDYMRAEVLVTHVRWGGVKKLRIYKNRSKKVVAGDDDNTHVELSSLVGDDYSGFTLKLESLN
jgi:hypothetical protein